MTILDSDFDSLEVGARFSSDAVCFLLSDLGAR
jgi:hypothetical protein